MKVRLDLAGNKAEIETDENGTPVAVLLKPSFFTPQASVCLVNGTAMTDGGKSLDRFSLVVSGATGHITKKGHAHDVRPLVDEEDVK